MLVAAVSLADIDGVDLASVEDAAPDRADGLLANLVDWSKATALEKIGEGERGLSINR